MKINKMSNLFDAVKPLPDDRIIPYIEKWLVTSPHAGLYEVDDRPYKTKNPDRATMNFHPSGDCTKCERLLYYERDVNTPTLDTPVDAHLQAIFKMGSSTHAMIQAWFAAMSELEGFPTLVENEMRIEGGCFEGYGVGGYIDSVIKFPGSEQKVPIEIKGLALDTPIPTPNGFKMMSELEVGDEVFAGDGSICKITLKSEVHHNPCYRITFDDGSSVVCDHEHRWAVVDGIHLKKAKERVLTTAEMVESGLFRDVNRDGKTQQIRKFRVRLSGPAQYPEQDLPIDPYVLGCWLADGSKINSVITKPAEHPMWDEIAKRGYEVGENINHKYCRAPMRTVYGIRGKLVELNLLGNKHIPEIYMHASEQQRRDLLGGIMDGDGAYAKSRKNFVLTMTDKNMVLQVKELMESLGMKTSYCEYQGHGFGKDVTCYSVRTSGSGQNPFKRRFVDAPISARHSMHRYITSIDKIESVPTQCIAVDSEDHTYLFGHSYIKTHNTINSYGFSKLNGPKSEHKMQIGCYIAYLESPFGIVLYYNKDTSEMKEFKVEPMDLSNVLMRWSNVRHAIATGSPERLSYGCSRGAKGDADKTWLWCPAKDICAREMLRRS